MIIKKGKMWMGGISLDSLYLNDLKVDSLVDLLKATYTLEDWDKMIEISDKLYQTTQESEENVKIKRSSCERHIVYYVGYSQLMKGIALQNKGQYSEAKELIDNYSDLSWLEDGSKEASKEVSFFNMFAKANLLAVNVLEGNLEYLDPYVQFLRESRLDELMPGLLNIIDSSLKNDFEIDDLLASFKIEMNRAMDYYKHKRALYIMKVLNKLSIYYLARKHYHIAIDTILQGLEFSNLLSDTRAFRKFTIIFESIRNKTSEDQQLRYSSMIHQLLKEELSHEKNISFRDGSFLPA
ncbi:hypothetical protein [Paenibacillus senegalimassiliensis]|uniref:hypothetical protein n=1 Tax=Paenibacillus senegalimassiliensis TaxID=1737426 RepID=UPI0011DCF15D|nr:hypothetical protein [Paenibacillus senegalimassiliensis]